MSSVTNEGTETVGKETEILSVGAQRSRDNRTLLVGFLLIGVYYLDNYTTLSLTIK